MKVLCVCTDPDAFPVGGELKDRYKAQFGRGREPKTFDWVEVGSAYVVYAITFRFGQPFYYVSYRGRKDDWFMTPGLCFEIVDDRLSRLWHFDVRLGASDPQPVPVLAIKPWVDEPEFFARLVDEQQRERAIMIDAVAQMDAEYA